MKNLQPASRMTFACNSSFCEATFKSKSGLSLHRKKCSGYKTHKALALDRKKGMAKIKLGKWMIALDAVRWKLGQKSCNVSKPYHFLPGSYAIPPRIHHILDLLCTTTNQFGHLCGYPYHPSFDPNASIEIKDLSSYPSSTPPIESTTTSTLAFLEHDCIHAYGMDNHSDGPGSPLCSYATHFAFITLPFDPHCTTVTAMWCNLLHDPCLPPLPHSTTIGTQLFQS